MRGADVGTAERLTTRDQFRRKLADRSVKVGVIGLGYVGLPLAHVFCRAGIHTIGFDIDATKVQQLNNGETYIKHISTETIATMNASGRFFATTSFLDLTSVDAAIICVPTPLTAMREPNLEFVIATAKSIQTRLRPGTLVVLESTTYPGTTAEVVRPILEQSGFSATSDFMLAFSPERVDPGNVVDLSVVPKIVGGIDSESGALAAALYRLAFESVYVVRDTQTAEAVKITENVFRAVNIALVNELKLAFVHMGIDIWEVIDAAKTKPYGYMPFYPGPGLGGHCIPIDPFYLSWRAKAFQFDMRLTELAAEINSEMPNTVVRALADALSRRFSRALNGAKVLVVGIAYKKNIDDTRESPALRIMELIAAQGGNLQYYDPHCPNIPSTLGHAPLNCGKSVMFERAIIEAFDAVLIITDHDAVDYQSLVNWSKLVIDTRNACRMINEGKEKVVRA